MPELTYTQLCCHQKTKMVILVAIAFALFLAATIMMIVAHANALEYAKDEVEAAKEQRVHGKSEFTYYNDRLWTMGNNESALNVASFSCMGVGQGFLTAGAIAAKHDQLENDRWALVKLVALSILIGSLFGLAGGWNSLMPVCGDQCRGPGPIAVVGGAILCLSAFFGGIGYEDYARRHQYVIDDQCERSDCKGNYVSAKGHLCSKCNHHKGDPLTNESIKAPDAENPAVTPLQTNDIVLRRRRLASPTMRRLVEDINRA